jgi:hypothetical protein
MAQQLKQPSPLGHAGDPARLVRRESVDEFER